MATRATAFGVCILAFSALAMAQPTGQDSTEEVTKLRERVKELEQENAKLKQQLAGQNATPRPTACVPQGISHKTAIMDLAVSPKGDVLASCGDETAKLWSLPEGKLLHTLQGHTGSVITLTFTPNGSQLLTAADDNTVRVWSTASGALVKTLKGQNWEFTCAGINPAGNIIVFSSGEPWKVSGLPQNVPCKTLGVGGPGSQVTWNPGGRLLAITSGGGNSIPVFWLMPEIRQLKQLTTAQKTTCMAFSADEKLFAAGSSDGKVGLWTLPAFESIKALRSNDVPLALAFSHDGKLLAAGEKNEISLWSLPAGESLATMKEDGVTVNQLAITPDGKLLVSGGRDKKIKLWSLPDGKPKGVLADPDLGN